MTAQTMEFKTEVQQLLDLMIHSLYSHKEIFLRELISNASDAIDKVRYLSLTNSGLLEGEGDGKIKIAIDKDAATITISDNGIGMNRDDVIKSLGTIAHSGTKEFIQALKSEEVQNNPELIGQFGVGFYSTFMVASKVTVRTRKAGEPAESGVVWESAADGSYTIDACTKENKGTEITLVMKDDEKEFLDQWTLRGIVRRYSDYIEYPIVMDVEKTEGEGDDAKKVISEETLNSQKAIWLKDKSDVSAEEYNEFYKHIAHDFTDPAKVIHYRAEGTSEFSALLYLPSRAPFDLFYKEFKIGPTLYVRRVQIMEHCEDLVPLYLRFVKGVVDSSDLPLNVSREILQKNRQVEQMRKTITKKVLDTLGEMKRDENDAYLGFYGEFGKVLKEGIHYDPTRKDTIADLLLFESTHTEVGKLTDLQSYIGHMPAEQEHIYYITGASRRELEGSPYLEAFKEKGYEVLFMLDEIDDFIVSSLHTYQEKEFKSAVKGDITLDKENEEKKKEAQEKHKDLLELIKNELGESVKEVRLSGRLKDSPCCLVAGEADMDPQMEKILKSMGQEVPSGSRILELNPDHLLFSAMNGLYEKDKDSGTLKEYARLLYDQALILEGSKPTDPAAYARSVARIMAENAMR
ncbi:Heat shock protein Hsp90-like protein [Desulfurispirillum indicum S5]|uniref:Chaperone protein HtpG n=1 Tax=Desulfurispirillum indicum (strain ATCC BAA-1389 / DSM 22839 / S5) TaxID=653733 RepID=E6W4N0_DESIS|nr:molecular chaperone HtpG [Desulfurispirillum indicum]ADU67103.1 Heat shock protein Hsp90-like protein [Desulfurispirillum indicum S5]